MTSERKFSEEELERKFSGISSSQDSNWQLDQNKKSQSSQQDLFNDLRVQSGKNFLADMKQQNLSISAQQPQQSSLPFQQGSNVPSSLTPAELEKQTKKQKFLSNVVFPKNVMFENFISSKSEAFFFFANHPKTGNLFQEDDTKKAEQLVVTRSNAGSFVYFSTCLIAYYNTKYLRYRNVPWGMTYRFSFLSLLVKYVFIPPIIVNMVDTVFFKGAFNSSMQQIYQNYDFTTNPIFREVFEAQRK